MFHVEQCFDLLLPKADKAKAFQRLNFIKDEYFKWNSKINLSAIRDEKNFWEKHIVDSLCLASFIDKSDSFKLLDILDIGSGGGFPGLVLASVLDNKVKMVDPIKKKTDFLNHIVLRLNLKNTEVYTGVFEDITELVPNSIIVSRALGNYDSLNEHFKAVNKNISVVVMATDKQKTDIDGKLFDQEYQLVNPIINNALKGHLLIELG
jgi:16S rRNA (guanine(527)-N(7))-methyltransferase RsmG